MLARNAIKACRHRTQWSRALSCTSTRHADFTHAVIGGGAVGLAIARRLQQVDGASVVLIEKHKMVGSETSSRNSEVSCDIGLHIDPLQSFRDRHLIRFDR